MCILIYILAFAKVSDNVKSGSMTQNTSKYLMLDSFWRNEYN